jgi:DNA-binding response OmpR family regulator
MLTARADLLDKVVGLEGGANDYLTKPFEPRELVARLHAQLRAFRAPRHGAKETDVPFVASGIVLDPGTLEVTWLGTPVSLTQMEFKLLRYFLEHPRRALSRENILNAVWGLRYPSTRTVDVHVMQLRQKFKPELFQTLHGTGYRFVPDDEVSGK